MYRTRKWEKNNQMCPSLSRLLWRVRSLRRHENLLVVDDNLWVVSGESVLRPRNPDGNFRPTTACDANAVLLTLHNWQLSYGRALSLFLQLRTCRDDLASADDDGDFLLRVARPSSHRVIPDDGMPPSDMRAGRERRLIGGGRKERFSAVPAQ